MPGPVALGSASKLCGPEQKGREREPSSRPPLKQPDAWVGSPVQTIPAVQGGTGTARLLQKDTQTGQTLQDKGPHLKLSAGRVGVKVFPWVKRGWLAGTVLAGMALFWSAGRGGGVALGPGPPGQQGQGQNQLPELPVRSSTAPSQSKHHRSISRHAPDASLRASLI